MDFDKMLGEWVGLGEMVVGEFEGKIIESMKIEETDIENFYSYIRKSRIDFGRRVTTHHELGYIRPESISLILSRGSYIELQLKSDGIYEQSEGTPDSKDMRREIIFESDTVMRWNNIMKVDQGTERGGWVEHTANTAFTKVTN